jgi:hypothetical protein
MLYCDYYLYPSDTPELFWDHVCADNATELAKIVFFRIYIDTGYHLGPTSKLQHQTMLPQRK